MEITLKQLKRIEFINKKIKTHFEKFHIFPNGCIYGNDKLSQRKLNTKCMMIYKLPIETLMDCNYAEVLTIYSGALSSIFNTKKDETPIKMRDLGNPYIDKNDNLCIIVWGTDVRILGKVVNISRVNMDKIDEINQSFANGFSDEYMLTTEEYNRLYNKEMVDVSNCGYDVLLNKNVFKTFTHHTNNNSIGIKYKPVTKDGKIFIICLRFTHYDKDKNNYYLDILTLEKVLNLN